MDENIIKSTCLRCNAGCGMLIHMKDGVPVRVEGDPDSPSSRGVLCMIGKSSLEYLNHPDRLKQPLKRVGGRGQGKWERITWDEALDRTASEMNLIKNEYGAKSVAFIQGGAKGYADSYLARFANVFGSPNTSTAAPVCFVPGLKGALMTYGHFTMPDYEYPPACILMWGANLDATAHPESLRQRKALRKGSKLIVIDPAETTFAKKADLWVKPRPGSDLALALGMIHVIINEDYYDKEFVNRWTMGFDRLTKHIQAYSPEKVEGITWVPAAMIKEAARLYAASKVSCLVAGNGVENTINNFQFGRAIAILRAITGNIGKPGGDIVWSDSPIVPKKSIDLHLYNLIPAEERAQRISAGESLLPTNFYTLHQDLAKAILEDKPYPLRAVFNMGGNPVITYANSREVRKAFEKLDFLVVSDLFITPTAKLADIVLPAASYLEYDGIHESEFTPGVQIVQKVAQVGECRSDAKIFSELGKRMGFEDQFWKSDTELLDFLLKPSGLTFEEFRRIGVIPNKKLYRDYEKSGFDTPSKKVEIYSEQLEVWGFDPLPVFYEPPESPFSSPDLAAEYPFVMTNVKPAPYIHSGGRQIETLRKNHPDPLVTINSDIAEKMGINEGDWVFIENKRGKIIHKATLSQNIDPRVVILEHGWWFPENEKENDTCDKANINILTYSGRPFAREMGSPTLRGLICKIYKA